MTLPPMNEEQARVVDTLNRSNNHTFITGRAGTGKTHVLRHFERSTGKKIVICAPTGIAALNAGGATIHNMLGLGTGLPADAHVDVRVIKREKAWLKEIDTIVIDEVSMVSSDLMDSIDRTLREIRNDSDPFGGIQIVMFGDPYQLPPVVSKEDRPYYREAKLRSEWFFDANVWRDAPLAVYSLETIHRQNDPEFKEILNAVRDGSVTPDQLHQINVVGSRAGFSDKGMLLAARKREVAERNAAKLKEIDASRTIYTARVNKGFGIREPAERTIVLKPGARVMMLSNDREDRWVNGSQGTVASCGLAGIDVEIDGDVFSVDRTAWVKAGTAPIDYKLAPKFHQIPVKLAWGVTIHKSQGLSLPEIEIDLGQGAFSPGQTYVALSRVTSPAGLFIRNPIQMSDIRVDPNVKRFFDSVRPAT